MPDFEHLQVNDPSQIETIMEDPSFALGVIETAKTLPAYAPENPSYIEATDKTRRAMLLELERAGVASIPTGERYTIYENRHRFQAGVARLVSRLRYPGLHRGENDDFIYWLTVQNTNSWLVIVG